MSCAVAFVIGREEAGDDDQREARRAAGGRFAEPCSGGLLDEQPGPERERAEHGREQEPGNYQRHPGARRRGRSCYPVGASQLTVTSGGAACASSRVVHSRLSRLPFAVMAELPGHELVAAGISDLARGVVSQDALLVSIGATRLRRLGFALPETLRDPEHRLYALLQTEHGDAAHGRYNALVRRLVSFERAAAVTGSSRA